LNLSYIKNAVVSRRREDQRPARRNFDFVSFDQLTIPASVVYQTTYFFSGGSMSIDTGWTLVHNSSIRPTHERVERIHEARALFDQALSIDPNDAEALAGSARIYGIEYGLGLGDPGTDYDAKVLRPANRAIALDPDNIRAHYTKSEYLTMSRRPTKASAQPTLDWP